MSNQQLQVDFTDDMVGYWKERSNTYSQQNRAQIESEKCLIWEQLIFDHAPQNKQLRILDVGTGPGFFAVILAQKGHMVTAVDMSAEMLEHAKANLDYYDVKADLVLLDDGFLPFADDTFDLVISRDVTWTLQQPEETLTEWKRVTKPGGKVLYFDANWYYHLYNEAWLQAHKQNEKVCKEKDLFSYKKATIIEKIARELPLSKQLRPAWDLERLPCLGFQNVTAIENLNSIIYTQEEQIQYSSKQEFLVIAEK